MFDLTDSPGNTLVKNAFVFLIHGAILGRYSGNLMRNVIAFIDYSVRFPMGFRLVKFCPKTNVLLILRSIFFNKKGKQFWKVNLDYLYNSSGSLSR